MYGMRYYAAWICRFVSTDLLQFEYPYYTPYQYAGNKPITFIDLDGAEAGDPEVTKRGEIMYIDSNSGRYLGSYASNDENSSIKSMSGGNFGNLTEGGNVPERLKNYIPINDITVDYDQITEAINSIYKQTLNKEWKEIEKALFIVFDTEKNTMDMSIN